MMVAMKSMNFVVVRVTADESDDGGAVTGGPVGGGTVGSDGVAGLGGFTAQHVSA